MQSFKRDDVKVDANKMSAGGLRPGQAVVSNSLPLNQASGLIGFAEPDMNNVLTYRGSEGLRRLIQC